MKDQITYLPDNADRSVAKQKFKITNWPTYNKALINRGSITFWLDDEAIQAWYESATPSSRGRPQRYSDLAITTVLVIKRVFRLTLRAAQGFIDSIFSLMNVPLRCPDYGTVAKLAMRQPFVLFKGLTFQKLCLPGAFRPGDHHNK
ncbi:transposase, partial [Escherichia coli]|nr:transposase [Escherichia coli]